MNIVKVGNYRINLDLIAYVTERISPYMQQRQDGTWTENSYANDKDRQPGLVVDVTFCALSSEYEMYVRLYMDEAVQFLNSYDRVAGI